MTDVDSLRLFIAVPAPPAVVDAAQAAADSLRDCGDFRWVRPENLHLTLKFLGETPAAQVPALSAELEKISNIYSLFVVKSGGVGAFPSIRRPQTLWLGIREGAERLIDLARGVESGLEGLGYPREGKPFRPHLTLARMRSPRGLDRMKQRLDEVQREVPEQVPWRIEAIHLIRSELQPGGPRYTPLAEYPLREDGS